MPLQTPSEPKRYTTVYSDFRGVDFTNDQTNVWKKRSPSGLNIIPDESGRPWKRPGWKIEVTQQDFIDIYCYKMNIDSYDGEFAIFKTYSFSLNGDDHIIIFSNLGVFTYTEYGLNFLRESGDPVRSFFFESGAIAGFYIFDEYKLFRYDGYLLTEVTPYAPTILISRSPKGGGTLYEAVNLISNKRTESFLGDDTSKTYYTSSPISDYTSVVVKVKNSSGVYETLSVIDADGNGDYSLATDGVRFKEPHPPVIDGEDNVLVTYDTATSKIGDTKTKLTTVKYNPKKSITEATNDKRRTVSLGSTSRYIARNENRVSMLSVYVKTSKNSDWVKLETKYYIVCYTQYGVTNIKIYLAKEGFPGYYTTSNGLRVYDVKVEWNEREYSVNESLKAFSDCSTSAIYGTGLINAVFMGGTSYGNYSSRVWYSKTGDPSYFPDTNYIEAGTTDTKVMGLVKVGEYLGIIKQGNASDSTIYLAYPVNFEDNSAYAVKQSVNGIGAVSQNCFGVLGDETLFLSGGGVMAIEPSLNENDRQVKNRSYYLNKKLISEASLENAISFIWNGFYIICVNHHCYVLDGAQKSSWVNEKTNMQYEGYYWENIPAVSFAHYDDKLWFADESGNLCRFKNSLTDSDDLYNDNGAPIECEWSTILDNDGVTNYFKNLQKKGCLVTLLPLENTGADVYAKADDKEPVLIGSISASNPTVPQEFYLNKKIKKYKRMQIIIRNNNLNQGLGIQEIIKVYTIGNYSKNRGGSNGY